MHLASKTLRCRHVCVRVVSPPRGHPFPEHTAARTPAAAPDCFNPTYCGSFVHWHFGRVEFCADTTTGGPPSPSGLCDVNRKITCKRKQWPHPHNDTALSKRKKAGCHYKWPLSSISLNFWKKSYIYLTHLGILLLDIWLSFMLGPGTSRNPR